MAEDQVLVRSSGTLTAAVNGGGKIRYWGEPDGHVCDLGRRDGRRGRYQRQPGDVELVALKCKPTVRRARNAL